MNKVMFDFAIKRINEGDFGAHFAAEIALQEASKDAFSRSAVFKRMCDTLLARPDYVSLHSEAASYFPESTKEKAGWWFANANDIQLFFSVVSSRKYGGSQQNSECIEDDFADYVFESFGLRVEIIVGQGTSVTISNATKVVHG